MLDSGTAGHQLASLPLRNDTVRRRIDEISSNIQSQLNDILRMTKFSLALDESTVRNSEGLLLGYARFKYDFKFVEEIIFCQSLETTTTAQDIYDVFKRYFTENDIPISNIMSVAADSAPAMMGKHKGVLKLLKNDNPRMMGVHCIIYRENLAAASISREVNQLLEKVISEVNWIKSRPLNERMFKQLCEEMEEGHIGLLLHTRVRWLSKGNCLEQFVVLYDAILEFVGGREEFQFLNTSESKALISYLADIFGKPNALNKVLQGKQKTLMDCKTQIFAFIDKLKYFTAQISRKNFSGFTQLGKCESSENIVRIISEHLSKLVVELNSRFSDLKLIKFPSWIAQPFLFNCESEEGLAMDSNLADELLHLQHDDAMKPIYASKNQLMWLDPQVCAKYVELAQVAEQTLLPFPTTYLVECAFSAVTDILTKKRGTLDICKRGDLRAKLTCFSPRFSLLTYQHEAHGSY